MFILSIAAGVMIGLSGIIYLSVGGPLGAFLFSIGLMTILLFQFKLFTGQAGYLSLGLVKVKDLCTIWFGNLIGTALAARLFLLTFEGRELVNKSLEIMYGRIANYWYENIIFGIFCGILMWIAVWAFNEKMPVVTSACVAAFILSGMNHCVADMFYYFMCVSKYWAFLGFTTIICTTIGNFIGCNLIPIVMKRYH